MRPRPVYQPSVGFGYLSAQMRAKKQGTDGSTLHRECTQIPGSLGNWEEVGRRGASRLFKTHMCMMSVSCRGSCLICGLTMAGWGIPVACGPGGPGTMWCENL